MLGLVVFLGEPQAVPLLQGLVTQHYNDLTPWEEEVELVLRHRNVMKQGVSWTSLQPAHLLTVPGRHWSYLKCHRGRQFWRLRRERLERHTLIVQSSLAVSSSS